MRLSTTNPTTLQLSGRSGELVESLYASTNKTKSFEKAVKELEASRILRTVVRAC
jgi:hypothetical protein